MFHNKLNKYDWFLMNQILCGSLNLTKIFNYLNFENFKYF